MRWLWRLIRWLVGFVVFLSLLLGIALALLALVNIQDARHVVGAVATALANRH